MPPLMPLCMFSFLCVSFRLICLVLCVYVYGASICVCVCVCVCVGPCLNYYIFVFFYIIILCIYMYVCTCIYVCRCVGASGEGVCDVGSAASYGASLHQPLQLEETRPPGRHCSTHTLHIDTTYTYCAYTHAYVHCTLHACWWLMLFWCLYICMFIWM